MTETQISIILDASSKPQRYFDESSCPFHESWKPAPNTGFASDPNDNRKDFARHLAHDLRQLALSAIQLSWVEGLELREDAEAPNSSIDEELEEYLKAISNAISARDEDVVKKLILMRYANDRLDYTFGRTPLSLAAEYGAVDVAKLLLETDEVDVNSKELSYRTPLSLAAEHGREGVVKLLLETGEVNVNSKDIRGWTPLSLAAKGGQKGVVKLLLETGEVDVNSKDINGDTPLSLAAKYGQEAVVKLLLETGKADVNSKDEFDETPLSRAIENGHEDVIKLLLQTNATDTTPLNHKASRVKGFAKPISSNKN